MPTDLNDLHLAELHERAAAADIPGYRLLRREELIEKLGGAAVTEGDDATERAAAAPARERPRRRRGGRRRSSAGEREGSPRRRTPPTEQEADADTDEMLVVEGKLLEDDEEVEGDADLPTTDVSGVLELTRQRYGFLRLEGLAPADGDVYISAAQVRRCELRPGDEVAGPAREPRRGERHRALVHVDTVNGEEPSGEPRTEFDALAPIQPERRIPLDDAADDVLVRAVDLLTPLAYGQRVLVKAAPRSGRTTLLRSIARAAAKADTAKVVVLLIDERPEEATAWREALPVAEFAIATADLAPAEQVRTAELALERARRLAESGTDAILICDSLSRLAFAGGDVSEVKRLFGSGRNLAGGGSLTVVATVLDDGRDEGEAERAVSTTESALVVLDAELAAAGVFPALRPGESQISNEDRIRSASELEAARRMRSLLADLKPSDAAALLRERIETTPSNAELLASI